MDRQAHRAKASAKMQAAHGHWRPLLLQQSVDKVRTAHGSDLHPFAVMYGAEVWHDEGGQRQDVSGRKESSAAF
jgi:hypothetical protein